MFLSLLACAIVNWPQSYRKSHEKAPDKDWKSDAEGECLNLGWEFLSVFRLLSVAKRYVTSNFADSIGMDVQKRSDVLQIILFDLK